MRTESIGYGYKKAVDMEFEEALQHVLSALMAEGFGVITEIDMADKFREKLGKDFRNYVILGACNPGFAYEALGHDIDIGLLLPCNVVVYEQGPSTVVSVLDADRALSLTGRDELTAMAAAVNEKLKRALESL